MKTGAYNEGFYKNLTPNVMMAATGIFILFQSYRIKNKVLIKLIGIIDKYSFGIYLVHMLVFNQLRSGFGIWGHLSSIFHPVILIPMATVLVLGISLLIVFVVNKLPFGKYISG